ncbi:hypothetical protein OVS_00720 [Mycoplasma ovis str. Michigan]|uniref:Uncharacterized protein n=1 Tax=Mycoplasma ovis str. Michigan TaxID=1415773 RepID=A0ABM5P176_9MOLU|nr:hypothetical protein [Mycoplasma ovis]AHC40134.1 hypothetical protein OVS_00720 [Mycoplasma ovis str. Michigan]
MSIFKFKNRKKKVLNKDKLLELAMTDHETCLKIILKLPAIQIAKEPIRFKREMLIQRRTVGDEDVYRHSVSIEYLKVGISKDGNLGYVFPDDELPDDKNEKDWKKLNETEHTVIYEKSRIERVARTGNSCPRALAEGEEEIVEHKLSSEEFFDKLRELTEELKRMRKSGEVK